jgi:uncharacterized membrane protein YesL
MILSLTIFVMGWVAFTALGLIILGCVPALRGIQASERWRHADA